MSIYQQAMGSDFVRLHPQVQRRFGFDSTTGVAAVGRGVMDRLWHGPRFTLPFLYVGAWRRIMFPEQGEHVPFTIENYAYRDGLGRETVTWLRTFQTRRPRRFDAYMIHSPARGKVVDYLGTHQHLAVDIDLTVDERGGLRLRSGEQRFYEGLIGFRFPLLLSGVADVNEWYDEAAGRHRITVSVANRRFGKLFGYEGAFDVEWLPMTPDAGPGPGQAAAGGAAGVTVPRRSAGGRVESGRRFGFPRERVDGRAQSLGEDQAGEGVDGQEAGDRLEQDQPQDHHRGQERRRPAGQPVPAVRDRGGQGGQHAPGHDPERHQEGDRGAGRGELRRPQLRGVRAERRGHHDRRADEQPVPHGPGPAGHLRAEQRQPGHDRVGRRSSSTSGASSPSGRTRSTRTG